jgi:FkbM family methyltransferase
MRVPRADPQGWIAAFTGEYDDQAIDMALSYVEPGSLVLDVGACFGFWTIPLAMVGRATVIALEPVQKNRDVLEANLELNGLTGRVQVLAAGLGAANQSFPIMMGKDGVGSGAITQGSFSTPLDGLHQFDNVEVRRLDDMVLPNGKWSFAKMDVEGYEMDVLEGAECTIAKHRPVIFGEFDLLWFGIRGIAPDAVERWAESHHYDIYEVALPRRGMMRRDVELKRLTGTRDGSEILLIPMH